MNPELHDWERHVRPETENVYYRCTRCGTVQESNVVWKDRPPPDPATKIAVCKRGQMRVMDTYDFLSCADLICNDVLNS